MKSTQAWGWLVAGVLALGLNGIYQDGGAARAHRAVTHLVARISNRTEGVLALAAGRADWFMAKAQTLAARDETASCRLATAMARVQTRLARSQGGMARLEAMSAREEAGSAGVEAARAQVEAQVAQVRFSPVAFNPMVCPRVRASVPRVQISVPMVHVEMGDTASF